MSSGQVNFVLTPSNSRDLLILPMLSQLYGKQAPYSQFILWLALHPHALSSHQNFYKSTITCRSHIFKLWIFCFTISCLCMRLLVSIFFSKYCTLLQSEVNPYIFCITFFNLATSILRKEMLKEENWSAHDPYTSNNFLLEKEKRSWRVLEGSSLV